jgi:S-layer homology domain
MERFIGAISLTVLLMGLTAVAQVQPEPSPLSNLSPASRALLDPALNKLTPDSPLIRAELAQLLVKTFQLRPAPKSVRAIDIPASHWAKADIQTVLSRGIMTLDRQGNFNPDQLVPRAEALAALAKTQGKKTLPESTINQILSRYPDAIQVPPADRGTIAMSLKTGSLPLESGKIAPLSPITRNDMVHALSVYQDKYQGKNKK